MTAPRTKKLKKIMAFKAFKIIKLISDDVPRAKIDVNNIDKGPTGRNGHLSIRDFTLNSCQKGAYLHINSPIIIIIKINNCIGKQHHYPLTQ